MAVRTTIIATAGVAIAIAGIAMFQDRLLYFPARASVSDVVTDELAAWPDADDFRGLLAEPAAAAVPSAATDSAADPVPGTFRRGVVRGAAATEEADRAGGSRAQRLVGPGS